MKLLRRLWYLVRRGKLERELEAEMQAHREEMGTRNGGFGNGLRLREESRDAWGWRWLDEAWQDLRHGLRILSKTPLYTATAIVVLSLGMGLNLALMQVLNAALWKPMEIRDASTMLRFRRKSPDSSSSGVPYRVARYVGEHNSVLEAVTTVQYVRTIWGDGEGQPLSAAFVTSNFFEQMGGYGGPGRLFNERDVKGPPVVVVSEQFFRWKLNSDLGLVGSTVKVNGRAATLIGVGAPGFRGPNNERCDAWMLMDQIGEFYPGSAETENWTRDSVDMFGRRKKDVPVKAVEDGLRAAMAELTKTYPERLAKDSWLEAAEANNRFRAPRDSGEVQIVTALLGGLSLLVLLIACSNVAGLGLAQATSRLSEFRMRSALGAGRFRVARQLLTEASVLALGGAAGGWLVGYAMSTAIMVVAEFDSPMEVVPDPKLAAIATGLAWITAMVVGLAPAWRVTRRDGIAQGLRDHGSTAGGQGAWMQRALLGAQVLGTSVLLIITALTARKLERMVAADFGFTMEGVAVIQAPLAQHGFAPEAARRYWQQAKEAASADPRMQRAALSSLVPMGRTLAEAGYRDAPGLKNSVLSVEPEFFDLMRIPIIRGRNFVAGDTHRSAIIIGQRLAERMYGTLDVVGKPFPKSGSESTIVGVTANATLIKITATDVSELFHPLQPAEMSQASLLVRMRDGVSLETASAVARRVNSRVVPEVHWLVRDFERRMLAPRLMWEVSRGVGGFALLLSSIGIFGLVAYTVALRTREIGVRVALGAAGSSIVMLVVRGLWLPLALGGVLGVAIGIFGLGRILSGNPFYLDPKEPVAIGGAVLVLAVSVVMAAIGPVRRALRIDPAAALRHE